MKEAQQYWKPGDAKPAVGEANSSGAAAAPRVKIEGARKSSKSKGDREERGGSGGEPKKRRKAGKGKEGRDRKVKGELPSISKAKSPAAGPSRTLLAMKVRVVRRVALVGRCRMASRVCYVHIHMHERFCGVICTDVRELVLGRSTRPFTSEARRPIAV